MNEFNQSIHVDSLESTSSKSTFSPNILNPKNNTTVAIGIEINQGTPRPAGMYPIRIATAATNNA